MLNTSSTKKNAGTWWTAVLITIAILALCFVVSLSFNVLTFRALVGFNLLYLVLILVGLGLLISFDSLSTSVFARASHVRIGPKVAVKASFLRVFVNMVTPFGIGGHPFVIAYLRQNGVPSGVGSSITAIKLVIVSLYVLIGGIWGFFWLTTGGQVSELVIIVLAVSIVFQGLLIFGLLFLMIRPQNAVGILTKIVRLFKGSRFAGNVHELKKRVIHEAWLTRRSFRLFLNEGLALFIMGCAFHLAMYLTEMCMLWFVFLGLGHPISFLTCIAVGSLTLLLLSFMPTPGGSGLGEGAFVVLFSGIAPMGILSIAVVLWRVFYTYIIALIGLILSPKTIRNLTKPKQITAGPP